MVIRLFMGGRLFYSFDPSENQEFMEIYSLKLKKEVNTISQLSFTILKTHPKYNQIRLKRSTFLLAADDYSLFIGNVSSITRNVFNGTVQIEVEELIGALRDWQVKEDDATRYTEKYGWAHIYTPNRVYHKAFDYSESDCLRVSYNADWYQYDGHQSWNQYFPSTAISYDSDIPFWTSEFKEDLQGQDYLSLIYNIINSWCDGHLVSKAVGTVSNTGGTNPEIYYDLTAFRVEYRIDVSTPNSYRDNNGYYIIGIDPSEPALDIDDCFVYGKNMISISLDPAMDSVFSTIIGTGTSSIGSDLDSATSTNIYTRNLDYITPALSKYGRVPKYVDFGDIGFYRSKYEAQTGLADLVTQWINEHSYCFCDKAAVNGIESFYAGLESNNSRPIEIGDIIGVVADDYGINFGDVCLSLEIDFFAHENDNYVIGPFIPGSINDYKVSDVLYDPRAQMIEINRRRRANYTPLT